MSSFAKFIVTVLVIIVAIVLMMVLVGLKQTNHTAFGIPSLIVCYGAYAAIRAIWKKDDSDKKGNGNGDVTVLQD